jgi:hypothetical protein
MPSGIKLKEVRPDQFAFWCPGCACAHHIYTEGKVSWELTGSHEAPTVRPSLSHNRGEKGVNCHYHLTEGKIEYFFDCFHELRSQVIDMLDWDERIHNQYIIRPRHENEVSRNRSPQTNKLNIVCGFNFNRGE